ncbi:unnamed protein product, partial [Ectocarpus sp. 8 AP-2014]
EKSCRFPATAPELRTQMPTSASCVAINRTTSGNGSTAGGVLVHAYSTCQSKLPKCRFNEPGPGFMLTHFYYVRGLLSFNHSLLPGRCFPLYSFTKTVQRCFSVSVSLSFTQHTLSPMTLLYDTVTIPPYFTHQVLLQYLLASLTMFVLLSPCSLCLCLLFSPSTPSLSTRVPNAS